MVCHSPLEPQHQDRAQHIRTGIAATVSHVLSASNCCLLNGGGRGVYPGGSEVKNPLPMQRMQETQVRSLGREDPLEKEMATHSSFLAWAIPWTEEPGGLQFMGSQRVRHC